MVKKNKISVTHKLKWITAYVSVNAKKQLK